MTSVELLPRLSRIGVNSVLRDLGPEFVSEDALAYLNEHASFTSYAATGGVRAQRASPTIAGLIRAVAIECGFPSSSGLTVRAKFDRDAAISLAAVQELSGAEGLRDDVWAYLTTVLLPDVARWRFPSVTEDRFHGGARNTLQRLHMRSRALDLGEDAGVDRWRLLRALTEDAHVAIFERPSIGGNPILAQAIARQWILSSSAVGKTAMEGVMRHAIKILRLRYQVFELGILEEDELTAAVGLVFSEAAGLSSPAS